jgi:hypothetical protein
MGILQETLNVLTVGDASIEYLQVGLDRRHQGSALGERSLIFNHTWEVVADLLSEKVQSRCGILIMGRAVTRGLLLRVLLAERLPLVLFLLGFLVTLFTFFIRCRGPQTLVDETLHVLVAEFLVCIILRCGSVPAALLDTNYLLLLGLQLFCRI